MQEKIRWGTLFKLLANVPLASIIKVHEPHKHGFYVYFSEVSVAMLVTIPAASCQPYTLPHMRSSARVDFGSAVVPASLVA